MSIKKKGKKIENFEVSYLLYPLLFDFFCKTYFRLAIYVISSIPKSMGKIKEYPKEIEGSLEPPSVRSPGDELVFKIDTMTESGTPYVL